MDALLQKSDGDISITIEDEEVAAFSDQADPVFMLETLLAALGYNVDTIERNAEEEGTDAEDLPDTEIA